MSNHLKTKAQAADSRAPLVLVLGLAAVIALGIAMLPFAVKAAGSDSGSSGSSDGSGYTVAVASKEMRKATVMIKNCLLYTSPSPRDRQKSRMPSSA